MDKQLITIEQVAKLLTIDPILARRMAFRDGWPCVKFSARSIRYTRDQVDEIVARYTVEAKYPSPGLPGQTARSRARTRR